MSEPTHMILTWIAAALLLASCLAVALEHRYRKAPVRVATPAQVLQLVAVAVFLVVSVVLLIGALTARPLPIVMIFVYLITTVSALVLIRFWVQVFWSRHRQQKTAVDR